MKRNAIIIFIISILGSINASAGPKERIASYMNNLHLKYGIEWGYSATCFDKYHSVYFNPEVGYRIDNQGTDFFLYSNAYVSARVGVEMFRHYSLAILAGYAGVNQDRRLFPATVRATYFMDSYDTGGIMIFGEGGLGMTDVSENVSNLFKLGTGYRLKMSMKSSLDFMASLQLTKDHPGIYSAEIPGYIPDEYVRRSDNYYGAVSFSIAISF